MLPSGELVELPGAEVARLLEKLVDEAGFAVVDVRDDRDVSEIHGAVAGVR